MEERILKIMGEYCEDIEDVLDYDGDNMVEDGIIDSFTVLQLVEALEGAFDITIPARSVMPNNFGTKEKIISLVKGILEEKDK